MGCWGGGGFTGVPAHPCFWFIEEEDLLFALGITLSRHHPILHAVAAYLTVLQLQVGRLPLDADSR